MFLSKFLLLFFFSFLQSLQCYYPWKISTAIANVSTVIACGSSIDIYPIFDPVQVIICPYVWIEQDEIQLISMKISFNDRENQLIMYSNLPLSSPPKILIKLNNNSFFSPLNLTRRSTYYLSFSSELLCRYSLKTNKTICFYYPKSSQFIYIEYQYDEIQHGSLVLSEKSRNRFYLIFLLMTIFIVIICFLAVWIICTSNSKFHHPTPLDIIIDRPIFREEAAKRPTDQLQDGGAGHHILADVREAHAVPGDG